MGYIKKELFLAEDRFGIKPLFYAKQSDTIFSSEIKAIYKTGLVITLNQNMITLTNFLFWIYLR